MNVRFFAAAGLCMVCLAADLSPGDPAPDLVVRDSSGASVKLSAYRQKKLVALLSMPAAPAAADWADPTRRLAAMNTVALFEVGPAATALIDRTGVVRRVLAGRALAGAELERFVDLWQSGKGYFSAYCARCHGEDGDSTLRVDKPLTGVAKRMSVDQIRETLRIAEANDLEVYIRGEMVKRSQLEALLIYVGSL